jgi:hypothetical protein
MTSYSDYAKARQLVTLTKDGVTITVDRLASFGYIDEGWTVVSGDAFDYSADDVSDRPELLLGQAGDADKVLQVTDDGQGYELVHEPGDGGYEFTGGFADRLSGQSGANDFGTFVAYTQGMADDSQWLRFGFSEAARDANDSVYWTDPDTANDPDYDGDKGLFGGIHNPSGTTRLIDFAFSESPGYSAGVNGQSLNYTAADGSLDFSTCKVGDKAAVRFDFNVIPQIANTTIEIAMIWQTRDANGDATFTFPLTGTPIFYGTGTVGKTFLNRPIITAYFASNEDVRAKALLAIKADNPCQIAPLTTLVTIQR